MEHLYETIIHSLIGEIKENYEGDNFDQIEELEERLQKYCTIDNAGTDSTANFLLARIIDDCPELYAQHRGSLKATLKYFETVTQSY